MSDPNTPPIDPELGIHNDPSYSFPVITPEVRARMSAQGPSGTIANLVASGPSGAPTPEQIRAREEDKARAAAEDPALGANSHPNYDITRNTTSPEGVAASRVRGPREQG